MNNDFATTGFLKITVLSGIFLFPIEGAKVAVISEEGENSDVVIVMYTDRGGSTGPIQLSAYDENYNLPSYPVKPVKTYSIIVEKEGYSRVVQQGIPVFSGIVSEKFVYMVPQPEGLGNNSTRYDDTVYSTENKEYTGGEQT